MPHTSALRQGAGLADSGPARRRPTDSNTSERLSRLSSRLDDLMRDVNFGVRSHRQHDRNVDEAEAIANELRAIFRSPTPAEHPPIRQHGGKAWW